MACSARIRIGTTFLLGLLAIPAFAALLVIQPGPGQGKDTFAWSRSGSQSSDFSANENHWASHTGSWFAYSYFQFDLSSLSVGATITSAELTLTHRVVGSWPLANTEFSYAEVATAWDQATTNWHNRPGIGTGFEGTDIMARSGLVTDPYNDVYTVTQTTLDITDMVSAWHSGALDNHGLAYWMTDAYGFHGQDHYLVSSDFAADASFRPTLSINYADGAAVPEPGMSVLMGLMALGLLAVYRP